MKIWLPIFIFTLLPACTHSIHLVHISDFQPYHENENGVLISASSEQFVILGFVSDTNYVDDAVKQLTSHCVGGDITGITTQFSTSHGFLSWTNKILIQGFCFNI